MTGLVKRTPSGRSHLSGEELSLQAVDISSTLMSRAYDVLRQAIMELPIYDGDDSDLRLDERVLAERLGISRTPVREALLRLESEGIVRSVPRHGAYVVRKTKDELVEVIIASAALEGAAARLAAERAGDAELAELAARFPQFIGRPDREVRKMAVRDYSDLNVAFHQELLDLAHSELFSQLIARLQIHMRPIRHRMIGEEGRMARSIAEHCLILEAVLGRDGAQADRLVQDHALGLADHVRAMASGPDGYLLSHPPGAADGETVAR